MTLIVVTGPGAVGKMTVGKAIADRTGFRLFHNHMSLDFVRNVFDWDDPQFATLTDEFRTRMFEEFATSDLSGLIFTYVWAFEKESEKAGIDRFMNIFLDAGREVYFVELHADQAIRLQRNETEFRLAQKPSKRDVTDSRQRLLLDDENHQLNSLPGEFYYPQRHLRIDNGSLSPQAVAEQVVRYFSLPESA